MSSAVGGGGGGGGALAGVAAPAAAAAAAAASVEDAVVLARLQAREVPLVRLTKSFVALAAAARHPPEPTGAPAPAAAAAAAAADAAADAAAAATTDAPVAASDADGNGDADADADADRARHRERLEDLHAQFRADLDAFVWNNFRRPHLVSRARAKQAAAAADLLSQRQRELAELTADLLHLREDLAAMHSARREDEEYAAMLDILRQETGTEASRREFGGLEREVEALREEGARVDAARERDIRRSRLFLHALAQLNDELDGGAAADAAEGAERPSASSDVSTSSSSSSSSSSLESSASSSSAPPPPSPSASSGATKPTPMDTS